MNNNQLTHSIYVDDMKQIPSSLSHNKMLDLVPNDSKVNNSPQNKEIISPNKQLSNIYTMKSNNLNKNNFYNPKSPESAEINPNTTNNDSLKDNIQVISNIKNSTHNQKKNNNLIEKSIIKDNMNDSDKDSKKDLNESFDKSQLFKFGNEKVKIGRMDSSNSEIDMDGSMFDISYLKNNRKSNKAIELDTPYK